MNLYFDIETHRVLEYDELTDKLAYAFESHLWDRACYDAPSDQYKEIAALYPEFSHVVTISLGYEDKEGKLVVKSFSGMDERKILTDIYSIFNTDYTLVGHNIIGFDIPYLAKRYVLNKMKIPKLLNNSNKKPWEVNAKDTMQMWKFGGWNNTSLQVIASAFDIDSKSTEYLGSNLHTYSIKDIDFSKLEEYCESDVIATYGIYKGMVDCF